MVQQADAEIVEENVVVPRLLHRTLAAERQILDELESRWGCSIIFPSTETASDVVTIKGPEWQIPQAVNEFLVRTIVPPVVWAFLTGCRLSFPKLIKFNCHGPRFLIG